MHPLEALNESELGSLTRVADRLLITQHLLAPGHRPSQLRPGFGIEFLDFREFSAGDDIRDIDWRATARSRHPQIRRYSDEVAADWFIVLDCSASMAASSSDGNDDSHGHCKKWQLAVQSAAAMAYLLIHLGNRVSILLFSNRIEQMVPLGRGYTHYASILQMLRQFRPARTGGGSDLRSCVLRIKRHSPVFVISDFLTADSMQDGLNALSIRGDRLHALQILSDQDYQLPTEQSVRFKDVETGQTVTAELNNDEREQHHIALTNLCNSLSDYCRKQNIRFSTHMDNEIWKSVLIDHLLERSDPS
jgi:uncharacterized protein (DUF58 family)